MSIHQELLGTIPGWITAGGMVGILGLIVKWQLGLKKLSVEAHQVEVNARAAANVNGADIRDHYAEELARTVQRQHDCEEREQALRKRVAELENDVLGLIRLISQASADKVLNLGPDVPQDILDMADRIRGRAAL